MHDQRLPTTHVPLARATAATAPDRAPHLAVSLTAQHGPHHASVRPGAHWAALARQAESAGADFVTAGPVTGDDAGLDPCAALAYTAPLTTRLGLVPALTPTHGEPLHLSAAIATLDHMSAGRAGWYVTPASLSTALASPDDTELWNEARHVVSAAAQLWESWEPDAEIRDTAAGRFIDRARIRHIDYRSDLFSIRGPSYVPRPPQGRPVIVTGLRETSPPEQWATAAELADVILVQAHTAAAVDAVRRQVVRRARGAGRPPGQPRCLWSVDMTTARPGSPGGVTGSAPEPASSNALGLSGTALLEQLTEWHREGIADGYHFVPATPDDLPAILATLTSVLRRLRPLSTLSTATTLRGRLGLPAPHEIRTAPTP
ncbi:LLM class flavin-dependent oxidoreductase [Streptomyces sp. NPDC048514]|uniref:LLM class flavin-dependent oxidoreductase n=1 Tax=Streptomyces sp. NPDC048514 TaxID=3365564 RepID=UPI0037102088